MCCYWPQLFKRVYRDAGDIRSRVALLKATYLSHKRQQGRLKNRQRYILLSTVYVSAVLSELRQQVMAGASATLCPLWAVCLRAKIFARLNEISARFEAILPCIDLHLTRIPTVPLLYTPLAATLTSQGPSPKTTPAPQTGCGNMLVDLGVRASITLHIPCILPQIFDFERNAKSSADVGV
jgi:hypothetical protein